MYNWDHLKILLAAYREGSVNKAGHALGLSPSTVSRRLAALEEALGVALFARTPDGLEPTVACEAVLPVAREAEVSMIRLGAVTSDLEGEPEGLVRMTMSDELEHFVVLPLIGELLDAHPKLRVEVVSDVRLVDLARLETDLALRSSAPVGGDELIAKRVRTVTLAPFASQAYVARWGVERPPAEHRWLGWDAAHQNLPVSQWLRAAVPGVEPVYRTNSMRALSQAAACGLGVVMIPRIFAALNPNLVELPWRGLPLPSGGLWMMTHRALRHTPRMRAVWDFMVGVMSPSPRDDDVELLRTKLKEALGVARWVDEPQR